ncbi:MAG: V-type ATP synthase subunit D [Desulfurococcus sp.]|nr:V-type ATP synthase subunit D [Desulfurococcus sp.]
MSTLQRVRPTKIELIRLKKRLEISVKVERILRERLTILINEFLSLIKGGVEKRLHVEQAFTSLTLRAAMLIGVYGENAFKLVEKTKPKVEYVVGVENIIGVKVKTAMPVKREIEKPVPTPIDDFTADASRFIEELVELARTESALRSIGREIRSVKRKVNAINHILIPRLESTIRMLELKFDEREREEKARLKRVKASLERGRSSG